MYCGDRRPSYRRLSPFFACIVFPQPVSCVRTGLVCPVCLVCLVAQADPSVQLDPVDGRPCDPSVGQLDDLRADQVADPHADLPFGPTAGLHDDPLDDPFDGLDAGLPADRRSRCGHRPARRGRCYRRRGPTRCWLSLGRCCRLRHGPTHYCQIPARCLRSQAHCCRLRHARYDCRLDFPHDRWPLRGAIGPPAHSESVEWSAPRAGLVSIANPLKSQTAVDIRTVCFM